MTRLHYYVLLTFHLCKELTELHNYIPIKKDTIEDLLSLSLSLSMKKSANMGLRFRRVRIRRKAPTSIVTSVCPQALARLPLDGFS